MSASGYPVIRDKQNFPAFLTASTSYVNVPINSSGETIWNTELLATKIFTFIATNYNVYVKILGSQDGGLTFNKTPLAETLITVGQIITEPISDYYSALKVQVKSATSSYGTLVVSGIGTSLVTSVSVTGGDASAANQATQITAEQAIQALLGGTGATKDNGPAWTSVMGVSGHPVSADIHSSGVAVTDAPTSGQKLVIDDMVVGCDASNAQVVTLYEESTVGNVLQIVRLIAGTTQQVTTRGKSKLWTADKKLYAQSSAAGTVDVKVLYHSEA